MPGSDRLYATAILGFQANNFKANILLIVLHFAHTTHVPYDVILRHVSIPSHPFHKRVEIIGVTESIKMMHHFGTHSYDIGFGTEGCGVVWLKWMERSRHRGCSFNIHVHEHGSMFGLFFTGPILSPDSRILYDAFQVLADRNRMIS